MKRLSTLLFLNFILCMSHAKAESLFAVTNSTVSTKSWSDAQICPAGQQQDISCLSQCNADYVCEKNCPCISSNASELASGQVITGIEFNSLASTSVRSAQLLATHTATSKTAVLVIKDQYGKIVGQAKFAHLTALDFKNNYSNDLKTILTYLKQASVYTANYKLRLYLSY